MSKDLCEYPEINLCCKKCGTKLKYKDSYKGYQDGGFVGGYVDRYVETKYRVECPFCYQIYDLEICSNLPDDYKNALGKGMKPIKKGYTRIVFDDSDEDEGKE